MSELSHSAPSPVFGPARTTTPDPRIQLLVDNIIDYAIFTLDVDGNVQTWNPGAQRIKGYAPHEIIGRHFSTFYTPERRQAGEPDRGLAIAAAEGRYQAEGWRVRKDGTVFWADVVITALRSHDGALEGFGKVTRDLTERRRGEEALRHSEERLRLMVESVSDYAILMLAGDGTITTWNTGAQRLTQYNADEVIGRSFTRFYPTDDQRAGVPQQHLAQATTERRIEDDGWRVRRDGSRFWANVIITALDDPHGSGTSFAMVIRDLTDRKRTEDALRGVLERERATSQRLGEIERTKQDLVSILAHDLRAPITVLHGTADMLQRDWDRLSDEGRRLLLDRMRTSSDHLRELVDDVLDVARIDAGRLNFDIGAVDVGSAVRRAARDVDPALSRVTVVVPDVPVHVRADDRRLWQVIMNLLSNALKFSPSPEPVEVCVEPAATSVVVSVADRGPGIAEADQAKLFQRFARLGPASAASQPGTGLGLYIARSIVEAQGGRIWVESRPGEGATFAFSLPRADDTVAAGGGGSTAVDGEALAAG